MNKGAEELEYIVRQRKERILEQGRYFGEPRFTHTYICHICGHTLDSNVEYKYSCKNDIRWKPDGHELTILELVSAKPISSKEEK